jgi:hypothetical protein
MSVSVDEDGVDEIMKAKQPDDYEYWGGIGLRHHSEQVTA